MAEEVKDVKDAALAENVQSQEENSAGGSADDTKVDRNVYEKVREDMLKYKQEKKAKDTELAELKARMDAIEATREDEEDEVPSVNVKENAKVEVLYLINTDPFVKENLDLIEEKMTENPKLTVKEAVKEVKSDFFDRMQKEVTASQPEVPPKQIKPKGSSTTKTVSDNEWPEDADPRQIAAYEATLARLK